jgi:hypothetical protein
LASSKEKEIACSFTEEMKVEVEHFGAQYNDLKGMILASIKDPKEQERLLNVAAGLTL